MLPSDMQLVVICIPDIRVEQLISSGYFQIMFSVHILGGIRPH